MYKVRIFNEVWPSLDTAKFYNGVDMVALNKGDLILWNDYTKEKLAVPIGKDDMILIFREHKDNED